MFKYDSDYISIPHNPICDNCGKPIEDFGINVVVGGKVLLVHQSYNRKTRKCQ